MPLVVPFTIHTFFSKVGIVSGKEAKVPLGKVVLTTIQIFLFSIIALAIALFQRAKCFYINIYIVKGKIFLNVIKKFRVALKSTETRKYHLCPLYNG